MQFGSTGSGQGQFNHPGDIAISTEDGVLYVTDIGNSRVQKFDSDGNFQGEWGTFGIENGEFNRPAGIEFNSIDAGARCVMTFAQGQRHPSPHRRRNPEGVGPDQGAPGGGTPLAHGVRLPDHPARSGRPSWNSRRLTSGRSSRRTSGSGASSPAFSLRSGPATASATRSSGSWRSSK